MITIGPIGKNDAFGNEINVDDICIMWRPGGLDKVRITKYNEKTDQMGVELIHFNSSWGYKKFSTPYDKGKFVVIRALNIP